jgi:Putative peptidoglycan binding domain
MATPAPCCSQALRDATARWPNRNRASDGIMGDADHQQRKSDHNDGNAFDLTHDPLHGVDCDVLSRQVINDRRVTYVIWDRQIYNRDLAKDGWRPYSGTNPHTHHMHVSIRTASRDNLDPWPWSAAAGHEPAPPSHSVPAGEAPAYPGTPLRQGSQGSQVRTMQQRLLERGWAITADGNFGPQTHQTVVAFQREQQLVPDGIVGPATWAALWKPVRAR